MADETGQEKKYSESTGNAITAAPNDAVLIRDLPEGTHVKLRSGRTVEITGNPRDGGWLFTRIVESPDDLSAVGNEDMVFCVDVVDVVKRV
jgi:hypothetical protein